MLNLEYIIMQGFGELLPIGMNGVDFIAIVSLVGVIIYTLVHLLSHSRYENLRVSKWIDKIF